MKTVSRLEIVSNISTQLKLQVSKIVFNRIKTNSKITETVITYIFPIFLKYFPTIIKTIRKIKKNAPTRQNCLPETDRYVDDRIIISDCRKIVYIQKKKKPHIVYIFCYAHNLKIRQRTKKHNMICFTPYDKIFNYM